MDEYQKKIKNITINYPDNLEEMYERYAYVAFQIYTEIAPNNFQEALKIANERLIK